MGGVHMGKEIIFKLRASKTYQRRGIMKKVLCTLFVVQLLLFLPWENVFAFSFELFGKDLDVKGSIQQTLNIKTHEDQRDIRFNSFRSTLRGEMLYKLVEGPDFNIQFYTLANYYYDYVLDIDSDHRHSVRSEAGGRHKYRDVRRPRDSDEWLSELYLDVKYKDFQVRLGKQLVSWGETAESRVADLINPLDLKYIIAFPDWEDYKLGLWMSRIYYTPPNMWQNMAFELIVIPFDFLETRVPPAGHGAFAGTPIMPGDLFQRVLGSQRRDTPPDTLKNLEIGLRIRGYSNIGEGVDWTLSHFYTRLDTPIIDGAEGQSNLIGLILSGRQRRTIWAYPHYNSTAFTFSTTWNKIGSAIRGECAYNTNRDYNYGTAANNVSSTKEKDLLTIALTLDRKTMIPWLSYWNRSRTVDFSFTFYQYWLLNHQYDKSTGEYILWESGTRDSSWTKFSLSATTGFFFDSLITRLNLSYDVNGNNLIMPMIVYAPGDHWQWVATYQQFNKGRGSETRYANQVLLSARYEF